MTAHGSSTRPTAPPGLSIANRRGQPFTGSAPSRPSDSSASTPAVGRATVATPAISTSYSGSVLNT